MAYLKSRWRSIAVFAVFSVIFATIFILYHIPLYAVRDGALLCLFTLKAYAGRLGGKKAAAFCGR